MVHVLLSGVKELQTAMTALSVRQVAATGRATRKGLHLIERRVKEQLTTSSHPRGTPTPSAAGEPPSLVSGDLRRGVQVEGPEPTGPTGWAGQVGPTMKYSRAQELGHPPFLSARPYMAPGFANAMPELAAIYRDEWAAALRG